MYQPHVLAVQANQPLHVVNDDPTLHNIHPTPANNRESATVAQNPFQRRARSRWAHRLRSITA